MTPQRHFEINCNKNFNDIYNYESILQKLENVFQGTTKISRYVFFHERSKSKNLRAVNMKIVRTLRLIECFTLQARQKNMPLKFAA